MFNAIPGSFTPGQGTTLVPHTYTFIDSIVTPGKWVYRLKQIDLDGTVTVFEPRMVDVTTTEAGNAPGVPTVSALHQNFPNPFNPSATIRFDLPHASNVSLKVYDLLGQEALTLVDEERPAGVYEVSFNAENLSSGMYVYRLRAGDYVSTRRMLVLK